METKFCKHGISGIRKIAQKKIYKNKLGLFTDKMFLGNKIIIGLK